MQTYCVIVILYPLNAVKFHYTLTFEILFIYIDFACMSTLTFFINVVTSIKIQWCQSTFVLHIKCNQFAHWTLLFIY